jgi:tRNA-specific 2-thiouridylase
VVRIEPESNRVVIGDDPDLLRRRFTVRDANWIAVDTLREPLDCQVQIRNRFEPQAARLSRENGRTVVEFETPQRAITPGQGAVFYWDDVVVGGGWIASDAA